MIVMIIFLALSVIIIIGTAIYLNIKKKENNTNTKAKIKDTEEKKSKTNKKKQLADILHLKIKDNIICLDNRYSSILKLGNIDYHILSNSEQDAIENILIQTALSIDYPIQFFTTTEFIDTSKVIKTIKQNTPKNVYMKNYQNYLINYLQNLMENRSISVVQNYVIISYDGPYENATEELNRHLSSFKASLLRANIACDILDENELYNLIYRELNKNSHLKIDHLMEGGKNLYVGKKQKNKR